MRDGDYESDNLRLLNRFAVSSAIQRWHRRCVLHSDTPRNTHPQILSTHHASRNTQYASALHVHHHSHSGGSVMVKSCFSHISAMTSTLHLSTRSMPELVKDS